MPESEPEHVLRMFLFFTKSEADVLINSVLRQNTACNGSKSKGNLPITNMKFYSL